METGTAGAKLRNDFKRLAAASGLEKQRDIAAALGVSQGYMNDVLNDRRRFTAVLLQKAAEAFQLSETVAKRWQRLGAIADGWQI